METNLNNITKFQAADWCINGHAHTIARSLLGNTDTASIREIEIPTPDDDFLQLDVAHSIQPQGVVVLFHGLEGSSKRYYIVELMKTLLDKHYSVVALNFRSCGSRMNKQPRFYHSGATKDYETVFRWVQAQFSSQKIGAAGFSLGGNALLKYLGENGANIPVDTAAAISVPYDLREGSLRLSGGFRKVYEYRFLRMLKQKLSQKRKTYKELPTFTGSTLYDFDDQITAPVHGFEDADDYYKQCSSNQFLASIKTPTLLIHSRQDPICPIGSMPQSAIQNNAALDYIITQKGGHVGFKSSSGSWLNETIGSYLDERLQEGG